MRRVVSVVLTIASVIAAVVVASTLARTSGGQAQAARRGVAARLPGSLHIVRFERGSSFAKCTGNSCSGGATASPSLQFRLPASPTPYRSTLTVSFRYRASGSGSTFVVRLQLFPEVAAPHQVPTTPGSRPVLGTGGLGQSMTLVFRPGPLTGGTRYGFGVSPDIAHLATSASISVSQVVYTLDAWRA